jgi:general secretion pathway protein A
MYKKFYRMKKEPFDSHPSPVLFYKSNAHQNGWHYLLHGIKKNEPILLVAGEYGAGKTLLYLKLMKLFETNTNLDSVCVSTPTYNFIMVLEKILVELGISLEGIDPSDESRLQQAIYEYFEKQMVEKKKFIFIIIDDVQEFDYSFINKLRLFASYNSSGYFPIRIILFAHPYFLKMLNHKKMVAFGQRIKRTYFLKPLGFEETREYIYFRLIHSGATGTPIFDDEAIKLIQTTSKGIPRLINNICDNCLLLASSEGCNVINASLVSQAMAMGNQTGFAPMKITRQDSPPSAHETPRAPSRHASIKPPLPRVAHAREFENVPPEEKTKNKISRKNNGSRYKKMSIIIILVLIMLFLFFYLFNQSKANQMYNLQSSIEQIHKSGSDNIYTMPDRLYTVENSDMLKKRNKNNLSLNLIPGKNKLVVEKKYQPIILMGNLM